MGGGVEGFSGGGPSTLSENMPHALVELGGLRRLLSRLQERAVWRMKACGRSLRQTLLLFERKTSLFSLFVKLKRVIAIDT